MSDVGVHVGLLTELSIPYPFIKQIYFRRDSNMLSHEAETGALQHVGSLEIDVAGVFVDLLSWVFLILNGINDFNLFGNNIYVFNSFPRFVHCLV